MQSILVLLLILSVLLADIYFIFPWLKVSNIFVLSIAFLVLTNIRRMPFFDFAPEENKYLKRLLVIFYIFLAYISLDNYLHGIFLERAPSIIIISFSPLILFATRQTNQSKLLFLYLRFFIIYNAFFSFMQFAGFHITIGSLLSFLPIVGAEQAFQGDTPEGLRVTGAYGSTLNIASSAGFFAIVLFYASINKLFNWLHKTIPYLIIAIVLLIATQTRAAFVGIIIAIIFVELLTSQHMTRKIKVICVLSVIYVLITYFGVLSYFGYTRLLWFDDSSFLARIQINYFAILGTLNTAPFLGVPYLADSIQEEKISKIIETGIILSNIDFGPIIYDFVTFHCEPAFYLRSYGLIGFTLYVLFYLSLFNYIKNSNKHPLYKKTLFCIIIFFFLFNLTHNGKIIQTLPVWILLSLDFNNNISAEES